MRAPAISLRGRAAFGATPVFGPLTLDFPAGAWTCLLGTSGAGKSTLLRLLAGLGDGIDFDGEIICDDGADLPSRTVLMQQSDMLLPWLNVLGNVAVGARLRGEAVSRERALSLIAGVGLPGYERRLPSTLSGGQRQRVALARTLMEDRPVVLLDEPFSSLDARTRAQMQDLAARLFAGRTVLLVTHDPGEAARLGTQVAVLTEDGLRVMRAPHTPVVRRHDAPEVLAFEAELLRALLEPAR